MFDSLSVAVGQLKSGRQGREGEEPEPRAPVKAASVRTVGTHLCMPTAVSESGCEESVLHGSLDRRPCEHPLNKGPVQGFAGFGDRPIPPSTLQTSLT